MKKLIMYRRKKKKKKGIKFSVNEVKQKRDIGNS